MYNFLSSIELLFHNYPIILFISSIALLFKIYILKLVFSQNNSSESLLNSRNYLYLILIGGIFEDFSWILASIKLFFLSESSFLVLKIIAFSTKLAWIFYAIEYQSLAIFLEKLVDPTSKINFRQQISIAITSCFSLLFFCITVKGLFSSEQRSFQLAIEHLFAFYAVAILMPISIYFSLKKIKNRKAPKILKKQFRILAQFLIAPRLVLDFIQYYPFYADITSLSNCYSVTGISTIFLTIVLYFSIKKIVGLRFLNFHPHVQQPHRYNFVDGFRDTLEELAKAITAKELAHITQNFFKKAFDIPYNKASLHIRPSNPLEGTSYKIELTAADSLTETFITTANLENDKIKVLIYDEIDFNNFYAPNPHDTAVMRFMDEINADIFLPIYNNQSIIGYIIVERYARLDEFYSNAESNEMLVFSSYLSNIINLLQNRNLELLMYQEKELKEELYSKHQEINHYKESMYSFLKNAKHKNIGIIFYKQRHFVFANQAAKEIVKINLNTSQGSPLTKTLKAIAQQVEEYKTPQSCITKTDEGERIVVNGVPDLEKNQIIITVCYPDFADLITTQLNNLKDPSMWDYLLYLETTKPGQFINQLIPGTGEHLLQFKINLLQIALSKKALLLEISVEDLIATVELIHHISMRNTLQMLLLQTPSKGYETAIKLFGINPIFGSNPENGKPLLEKLDGTGTLFIQNIEFLDLEIQEYLAEFIKYGYYRIFKSSQKMTSSVRIICSTSKNLQELAQDGSFSAALLNELKKTSLTMPSLLTLPELELTDLAQGLAEQTIKSKDFKNILDLNQRDKIKIIQSKPSSISQLKERVQQLLEYKSKENQIEQEIQFNPAYDTSDPDLIQAARLGKHALRDRRIMNMLWNKFKNQNKIASFLGVNRSSVNRRCKEYKLL